MKTQIRIAQMLMVGLLLLWQVDDIQAQNQLTVSGTVTEQKSGDTLPGVNVVVKGTTRGTSTDADGKYEISVAENDTLVFSAIGYTEKEVPVSGRTSIDVVMTTSIAQLGEMVVTGYGTQQKSSLTASVESISSEEVQKQITGNVASAFQGRVPGVNIVQEGGIAGGDVNILIRGAASFGSTQPLVVIDGAFSNTGLNSLNPRDIESIEILKDAAAAAIYGSRASNGVVLITTKNGRQGKPLEIELNANYSFQTPSKKLDYLNADQWRQFANQVADNSGIAPAPENVNPSNLSQSTDWQDLFFRNASVYNFNLGLSGGGENTSYYASFGYYDEEGIIKHSSFKRYNLRLNTTYSKNNLTISENLAIAFKDQNPTPGIENMPLPTLPAFNEEGNIYSGGTEYYMESIQNMNPLAIPHYREAYNHNLDVTGGVKLNYEFVDWLEYEINFSGSLNRFSNFSHLPEFSTRSLPDGSPDPDYSNLINSLSETRGNEFNYTLDNLLRFDREFSKHSINLLLGTSWHRTYFRDTGISTTSDLGGPNIVGVDGEGQISAEEANSALLSFFSRLNYNYDSRYLFSASIRRDKSSKFHEDFRVGYLPSISAGWNLHNEPFFNIDFISKLKIRGSYGELGANFIDPYSFSSLAYGPIPAIFGESQARQFGRVAYIADKSLQWETSISKDVGLEIGLWGNSLSFSMDYFIKTNEDLLARLELTPSSGQTIVINDGYQPVVNATTVENRGLEFKADYRQSFSNDFFLNSSFNISFINNKVLELGENVQPIRGELISGAFNDRPTITDVGLPIGSFYGYRIEGIDDNGDFIFEDNNGLDANGKETEEPDGEVNQLDKVILGNPTPDFTYGLNISGDYKQFDFTIFFQGVYGNEIFNQTRIDNYFTYNSNVVEEALNAWTPSNTDTNIPRMTLANEGGQNALPSDFYIEDGSYLRLKNFQVGYNFSSSFLSAWKISNMRIYLGAQNLLTITGYSGYDPEVSSDVLFNRGVDFQGYPNARQFKAGFSMSF